MKNNFVSLKDYPDLKVIKKKYGEDFAKLCRKLFPTLLEEEGRLSNIIISNFNESRNLYHDIVEENYESGFKRFVLGLYEGEKKLKKFENIESPEILLDRAGYKLFKCETAEDIRQFKKYYAQGEELCTFKEAEERIEANHVFFAVKKNIDEIKRENFPYPKRQDEYGTSIMSFQFNKEDYYLYISNRYNHVVRNPDATFAGDLDNIVEGLTYSFQKYYDFDLERKLEQFNLPPYMLAKDGKYYTSTSYYENNIDDFLHYGCGDNIFIENYVPNFKYKEDKSRFEVFEFFILDKQTKKLFTHKKIDYFDAFLDEFYRYEKGKKISTITRIEMFNQENDTKKILLFTEGKNFPAELIINRNNDLISYKNPNIKELDNNFLYCNVNLEVLDLPNCKKIGNGLLYYNFQLKKLNLPKVRSIGNCAINENPHKMEINAPRLYSVGNEEVNEQLIKIKEINVKNLKNNNIEK